jgi:hypothetical protein
MGRDRTQEFFSCVESLSQRAEHPSSRLLSPGNGPKTRGEFTKAASLISNGINETVARLTKFTNLVKKKSMFGKNLMIEQESVLSYFLLSFFLHHPSSEVKFLQYTIY